MDRFDNSSEKMERSRLKPVRNTGVVCAVVAIILALAQGLSFTLFALPMPIITITLVAIFLAAASLINDFLISKAGLTFLKSLMLASCLCLTLIAVFFATAGNTTGDLIGNDANMAVVVIIAIVALLAVALFASASILLWGASLTYYRRSDLLLTTAISFLVAGISLVLTSLVTTHATLFVWYIALAFGFASAIFSVLGQVRPKLEADTASRRASQNNGVASKGNRFTLFSIGLSVGVAFMMFFALDIDLHIKGTIAGGTVIVSALLAALLRQIRKSAFEDFFRRTIAVFTSCTILPYPFLNTELQTIFCSILLISVTINCIILIDAIAETARMRRISPFWIIGKEGAVFMIGMMLAILVLHLGTTLIHGSETDVLERALSSYADPDKWRALMAAIYLPFVVIFIALQVFIEEQTYPYFDSDNPEDAPTPIVTNNRKEDLLAKGGGRWREHMDQIAAKYGLSPRQYEIMRLLVKGRDIKYIMAKFTISQATAKTHVYNLYRKLGIHSRFELLNLIDGTTHGTTHGTTQSKPDAK